MSIERLRAHYGFSRMPFGKDLAPSMLHPSRAHAEATARIAWCIDERALGLVIGEQDGGRQSRPVGPRRIALHHHLRIAARLWAPGGSTPPSSPPSVGSPASTAMIRSMRLQSGSDPRIPPAQCPCLDLSARAVSSSMCWLAVSAAGIHPPGAEPGKAPPAVVVVRV